MDSPTAIRGQVRFLAVMAGCNVLLPYLGLTDDTDDPEFLLMTVFSGMVAGQGAVLSLWFVWASGNLWLRVVWVAAAVMVLCPPGLVGVFAAASANGTTLDPRHVLLAVSVVLFTLPPISLAVQLPLWVCRLVFGWRIEQQYEQVREPPLSILDLLSGTALVAAALGCIRLLPVILDNLWSAEFANEYWMSWGISAVILAAASSLVILPLVAIVLRPDAGTTSLTGGGTFIAVAVVLSCLALGLLSGYYGGRAPPGEMFAVVAVFVLSLLTTLIVPTFMAHSQGFRLKFGRDAKTIRAAG